MCYCGVTRDHQALEGLKGLSHVLHVCIEKSILNSVCTQHVFQIMHISIVIPNFN